MAEELKRYAYQAPQTSMERHLVELVEHVRHGYDNRAGFAEKIEAAQDHAFWLEKTCAAQRKEIERLYTQVLPGMPHMQVMWKRTDTRDPEERPWRRLPGGALCFEWEMEKIHWKGLWNGFDHKDAETERQVKRRTYRELLRMFRFEFEKTFRLNMERLRNHS